MRDPLRPFVEWLAWLDSHDGLIHRRNQKGTETDSDIAALIPTPPGQTIFTVGDLRALVAAADRLQQLEHEKNSWGVLDL